MPWPQFKARAASYEASTAVSALLHIAPPSLSPSSGFIIRPRQRALSPCRYPCPRRRPRSHLSPPSLAKVGLLVACFTSISADSGAHSFFLPTPPLVANMVDWQSSTEVAKDGGRYCPCLQFVSDLSLVYFSCLRQVYACAPGPLRVRVVPLRLYVPMLTFICVVNATGGSSSLPLRSTGSTSRARRSSSGPW